MFRVRSKRSVLQAAVAIPVAALLLTGCGDDAEAEPAASSTTQAAETTEAAEPTASAADDTVATPSSSETLKSNQELLDDAEKQLELAGAEAGSEQLGALTCETMRGFMMTADEAGSKEAVSEGATLMLSAIVKGAQSKDDSVKAADLDSTTKKECAEQRDEVLEASGAKSLASFVKN